MLALIPALIAESKAVALGAASGPHGLVPRKPGKQPHVKGEGDDKNDHVVRTMPHSSPCKLKEDERERDRSGNMNLLRAAGLGPLAKG